MIDDATIEEAGRRPARSGARVILLGSHARGDAGPHSDLDFLVIERDVRDELDEAVRLRRALRGLCVPVDVIVVSEDRARAWQDVKGSFLHAALSNGRVLHGDG